MRETAVRFGSTNSLVGIITDPPEAQRGGDLPAVIFLDAGVDHRIGPNRLYVKIARDLAALGFVTLRFDFSGIGDSDVRQDHLPFAKSTVDETQEAMNLLSATRGAVRFVLLGFCSGAVVAFQSACCDPRVVGAILINTPMRQDSDDHALNTYLTNYFYWNFALFNPKHWVRFITGKSNYWHIIRDVACQARRLFGLKREVFYGILSTLEDIRLLIKRDVRLLYVYAESEQAASLLPVIFGDELHELIACGKVQLEIIPQANHSFTLLQSQTHLLQIVHEWAAMIVVLSTSLNLSQFVEDQNGPRTSQIHPSWP
jgi:pimeloyl-ACP methyl ester carboxylesterase